MSFILHVDLCDTVATADNNITKVEVHVIDVNDHAPVFVADSLLAAVAEEAEFDTTVTVLRVSPFFHIPHLTLSTSLSPPHLTLSILTLSTSPHSLHLTSLSPPHLTLSTSLSPPHLTLSILTLSTSPSSPHPLHLTLSCSPYRQPIKTEMAHLVQCTMRSWQ